MVRLKICRISNRLAENCARVLSPMMLDIALEQLAGLIVDGVDRIWRATQRV